MRVRGWDFCPAAEKEHQNVHHGLAGSDGLISATWLLKFIWILSIVLSGRGVLHFNTETQLEQEQREGGTWEGRHCSLHPTPCTLTDKSIHLFSYVFPLLIISSGDLGFFIVPAEPVSSHTKQFSSPNREVSLFFPFGLAHLCGGELPGSF